MNDDLRLRLAYLEMASKELRVVSNASIKQGCFLHEDFERAFSGLRSAIKKLRNNLEKLDLVGVIQ